MPPPLADLTVLVLDGQATGPDPGRDCLLELGWARFRASSPVDPGRMPPTTFLLRLPEGYVIPGAVRRITGITEAQQAEAVTRRRAWSDLRRRAGRIAAADHLPACPTVVHFARFEEAFLRDLHLEFGPRAAFPFQLICTHAIARRLLPGLPRKGLRAVAGYFGHSFDALRRSQGHVRATAWIWRHLVERLESETGISSLESLLEWLKHTRPDRGAARIFPMAPERWKGLPDLPGVYRMRGKNGRLLYIGKAASLKKRVAGYFRPKTAHAEHILEMLAQAFELEAAPTATALEAALLESDEIKRFEPPYNVALKNGSRRLAYFTTDLTSQADAADPAHPVGPIPAGRATGFLQAFGVGFSSAWRQLDEGLLGVPEAYAPDPGCRREGLQLFLEKHPAAWQARSALRSVIRLGVALQRASRPAPGESDDITDALEPEPSRDWSPEGVLRAVEAAARHAALLIRRARWLVVLGNSVLGWPARGAAGDLRRVIVLQRGKIRKSFAQPAAEPLPLAAAGRPPRAARFSNLDFPTYERLRVLTTEIRRLVHEGRTIEMRPGSSGTIKGRHWQKLLEWI